MQIFASWLRLSSQIFSFEIFSKTSLHGYQNDLHQILHRIKPLQTTNVSQPIEYAVSGHGLDQGSIGEQLFVLPPTASAPDGPVREYICSWQDLKTYVHVVTVHVTLKSWI